MSHVTSINTRTIALGYLRSALVNHNAIEHQRLNISNICDRRGWKCEFYEDNGLSGLHIADGPGWQALNHRLKDHDVVALIVNDLSRISRSPRDLGSLLEHLDTCNVSVILAASGTDGMSYISFQQLLKPDTLKCLEDSKPFRRRRS